MTSRSWTPARIEQLRALALAGKTGQQAGDILGCNRNATISAAIRYGFHFCSVSPMTRPRRPHPAVVFWTPDKIERIRNFAANGQSQATTAAAMGVTEGSLRHWAEKNGIHFGRGRSAARPGSKMPPQRLAELSPPDGSITILDLTEDRCHWPYGDPQTPAFRYCGEAIKGEHRVYCSAHHAMAYQPRTPWMRRAA